LYRERGWWRRREGLDIQVELERITLQHAQKELLVDTGPVANGVPSVIVPAELVLL